MSAPAVVAPDHLPGQVADRLAESTDADALADALDLLRADRSALISWFRSVLLGPALLATVAARSYWHANGFAKLILHDTDRFRIRLHVWPAGEDRRGESDPHSHRWDFASAVLAGDGLAMVEWVERPTPIDRADLECTRYRYDGARLAPDPGPQCFLHAIRDLDVASGELYKTGTTTIHTVAPKGSDLVATLLVQGPHVDASTAVYGNGLIGVQDRSAHPVTTDDVLELIASVVAALD